VHRQQEAAGIDLDTGRPSSAMTVSASGNEIVQIAL
jgi:hypothetical protein